MLPKTKQKILIVDDQEDIRDLVKIILGEEDYIFVEAGDGEEALEKAYSCLPDLIFLDYKMPKLDGSEVCCRLKKDIFLRHLPIIMLTAKGEIIDKVKGIDAGVDDYIVKPFEPQELLARLKVVLRRTMRNLEANPLTRLPGNISILKEVEGRIKSQMPFVFCHIDLDRFKTFNDKRGFEEGDRVIRETVRILIKVVQKSGNPNDFIGHIGGDDFVIISTPDVVDNLRQQIIEDFDKTILQFYNPEERRKGYVIGKNRQGKVCRIPLISISIGVMTSEEKKIEHVAEVGEIAAELKSYAKSLQGSNYVKDRRKLDNRTLLLN